MELRLEELACGYGKNPVMKGISLSVKENDVLCLLGPNGSGKTTFFKTVLGLLKCVSGGVFIDGKNIQSWSHSRIARCIAYVPQSTNPQFPYKVSDVVLMGRAAHLKVFCSPTEKDNEVVKRALKTLDIYHLRNRSYTEISGGERQLVLIARAIAQQAPIILMDEPTTGLDFGNQILVLGKIQQLAHSGLSIVMACHFPEHAFMYGTKAVLFKEGQVFDYGTPTDVISPMNIKALYGVDVEIAEFKTHSGGIAKMCVPDYKKYQRKIMGV